MENLLVICFMFIYFKSNQLHTHGKIKSSLQQNEQKAKNLDI